MSTTASSDVMPSAWAGGPIVCIPHIGTGRIICEGPRVIEISLPAPECAVFLVNDPTGPRAVVLTDPRVPWQHTARAIAAARHLEDSADDTAPVETLPAVAGDATPPAGLPVITVRPDLQIIQGGRTVDTCTTGG